MSTTEPSEDLNALNEYFRLKQKYEEPKYEKPRKKVTKRTCISCNRPGGTMFSQNKNEYLAVCLADPPCSLQMHIRRSFHQKGWLILYQYKEILEKARDKILALKNDVAFEYLDESQIQKIYEDENTHYEATLQLFTELYSDLSDEARAQSVRELTERLVIQLTELRDLLEGCKQGAPIYGAVEKHMKNVVPLIEEIRATKYKALEVINSNGASTHNRNSHCQGGSADERFVKSSKLPVSVLYQSTERFSEPIPILGNRKKLNKRNTIESKIP
jgi:hypothetical protein